MVGRAVGLPEGQGVRPGTYCEPKMTTVGSQDTTGPMTRDELRTWPASASRPTSSCSPSATRRLPQARGRQTHRELPAFISNRGGVPAPG